MGTRFVATGAAETFTNPFHMDEVVYEGGDYIIEKPHFGFNGANWFGSDANFNNDSAFFDQMLNIIRSYGMGQYDFFVYANNSVDYSNSDTSVSIDLTEPTQQGGFAQGDHLVDMFKVIGSSFNDVIRGSDSSDYFDDLFVVVNGYNNPFENSFVINNPATISWSVSVGVTSLRAVTAPMSSPAVTWADSTTPSTSPATSRHRRR